MSMSYYEPDQYGELLSLCWCQSKYVPATPAMVRAGLTQSCGQPDCHPHDATPDEAA